jgi:ABC-type phosphate transport system permease subunit
MPPRPRTKVHNATPSQKKKKETASVVNQANRPSQTQEKKRKTYRYTLLFIPILCLMALNSLVTFLYTRSLDPLYGSVAVKFHLDKIVWTATIMGAFGPVPSLRPSLAILGGLVTSIPVSFYWTAVYTGKTDNPVLGSTVTHLVVLFPVIYIGVSLVKHITVGVHALHSGVHYNAESI